MSKSAYNWGVDEMYVKIRGNMKYPYVLMDEESRFWIAKQVSDTKYTEDVRPLLVKGKQTYQMQNANKDGF
ncbi:MAG: DDE-type integrase/transposase/recombinase [Thaumarchaeota archaeon]|nr:DDE-type integrase/transposase/recombinase [Nitrososphaerota archaeon]MDE1826757.1 DDE-type integrase/transposase/recombinase [Nitrososphaerota archaeon]